MENIEKLELSVKDYAMQRGKTVQAVYQQLKSKENLAALEGHVIVKRVGNKDVKFLDQKAVEVLDEASTSAPVVYLQEDLKMELDETRDKLQIAERQVIFTEGKIQALKDLLAEKERELRALAEPQARIVQLEAENEASRQETKILEGFIEDAKKEISVLTDEKNSLKAQNRVLSDEKEKQGIHLANTENKLQKASDELTAIKSKWWYKLFGRKD